MADQWKQMHLGEIADLTIGRTPPRKEASYWTSDLERPFCSIADIDGRSPIDPVTEGVTEAAERDGKAKRVPAGSLLMTFKLSIGRTGVTARDVFPNEAIAWIQPNPKIVLQDYLRIYLPTLDFEKHTGVAVKGQTLNMSSLKALPVLLPPLDVQHRIVDLIDALSDVIRERQAVVDALEVTRRTVLAELIDAEAPGLTRIGDVAKCGSGSTPKAGKAEFYEGGTVPFLKIGDLNDRDVTEAETFVTEAAVRASRLRLRKPGTVLVGMYGSIGKTGYLSIEATTNQAILGLEVDPNVLHPRYLHYCLLRLQAKILSLGRGATQKNINKEIVEDLKIPVPPVEEQCEVIDVMAAIDSTQAAGHAVVVAAEQLRVAVLRELLSGSVPIPESYDRFLAVSEKAPADEPDLVSA